MTTPAIRIYTDGSCHTQLLVGAWAAIIFMEGEKIILKGEEYETTHNRMELQAVISAVNYLKARSADKGVIEVYSDSQYVVNIQMRKEKLKSKCFLSNKGSAIQNADLVRQLIEQIESYTLHFIKVKAHQKGGDAINREVDGIVRKLMRKHTKE